MFAAIGAVLQTFRVYENIFAGHHSLLHALSVVYLDIITFCMNAKRIFIKAKQKKGLHSIQLRILWRPFDREFGDVVENFHRHKKNVERQASLAHMIEAANEREAQLVERNKAELEKARQIAVQKELKRLRILKKLSNIDHESRHRQLRKMRCGNTGNWIFKTQQYMEWIVKSESCCLWCYGIPGSGKTIITSTVVDNLIAATSAPGAHTVIYFYCDYSNSKTLEASGILENFILQLLSTKTEIPDDIQSTLLDAYKGIKKPDTGELLDILLSVIKLFDKVFLVLDGIDECGGSDRVDLLTIIQSIMKSDATTVKIFLASRADVDLERTLGDYICLPISADDIAADIETFVNDIIESKVLSRELVVRDPKLVREILDALVNGAQGMFIWVTFQIEDLCEQTCDSGIREVLGNLPVGLVETYTRALRKIHTKRAATAQLAQKVFKWMACARRPLTMDEIKEAISISPGDKYLDPEKITTDSSRIIQACANLVVFDSDEGTIRFAHYSVQEFLLYNSVAENTMDIHFHLPDAEREVGEICLTYLSFSHFRTQVSRIETQDKTLRTDLSHLGLSLYFRESYLGRFMKVIFDGWMRFRGCKSNQSKFSINWGEYLKQTPHTAPSPELEQQYRLLDYVTENWAWHTMGFSNTNTIFWPIFRSLALERQLPFSFRPWGNIEISKDLPYISMVVWAVETSHEPLLRLLLEPPKGPGLSVYLDQQREENGLELFAVALNQSVSRGYSACVKLLLEDRVSLSSQDKINAVLGSALYLAVDGGHHTVIRLLLEHGATRNLLDNYWNIALNLVAERGYDACIKLLLESGCRDKVAALHRAANDGEDIMVELLLARGVDPNPMGENGTALHLASEKGYDSCVKVLLDGGAGPDLKNSYEETALHLAAEGGKDAVVKLLLDGKANLNLKNSYEDTALHLAVRGGNDAIVKLLLDGRAELDLKNSDQNTALHIATFSENVVVVKLLLDHRAGLDFKNSSKNTALHLAVRGGNNEIVKLLLDGGAKPDLKDFYRDTALNIAVRGGKDAIVKLLLDGRAELDLKNSDENTALHIATFSKNVMVIKLLLDHGAGLDFKNSSKNTALHLAVMGGNNEIVKLLLGGGAKPDLEDSYGDTALNLATRDGNNAVVELLLERGANLGLRNSRMSTV